MANKKLSAAKLLKGILFGSVVGGTTALLLAPRSGKETQAKIEKEVKDNIKLVTDVKDGAEEVQLYAANVQYLSETLLPEFIDETKKSVEKFKFKSKYRIKDIEEQIDKINTELENLANDLEEKDI